MCDPFLVLNDDIHRFILQHFDASEIQRLSCVSQLWYLTTSASRECMKKLIYSVDNESQMKVLKWSSRRYENFKVTPYFLVELTNVLKKFRIKSLRINEIYGKEIEHKDYIYLIESCASTVECLMLCDVATRNSSREAKAINFPNLRKCHCSFTNRTSFSILLGHNPKLEHVVISADLLSRDDDEFIRHDNVIIKFLMNNQNIQKLCFLNLEKLFVNDVSLVTNAVKHFTFTANFINKPKYARDNFLKFLSAQSELEKLNMMGCQNKRILIEIWNCAKSIKKFIIDCNIHDEINVLELQTHPLIEEIDFYLTSSLMAIFFLRASPNLKYLKVRQLSKKLLEHCIHECKQLEVITFQSIDLDAGLYYKEYRRSAKLSRRNFLRLQELDFFEYLNFDKRTTGKLRKKGFL